MLPVLVARREWALLRSFTVSAIALSAVGVVLLGPAATTGYVHVMTTLPQWGMHSGQMLNGSGESLYGFFHGITGWSAATVAWGASSAVILGFTCWYSTRQTDASASFAMAITGALLISPHLMSYGLTLALLAVTVMWSLARKRGLTTVPFLVAGYIAVVAGIPIEVLTGVKITPLVVALLTVALAWVGRRSPESASSTRLAPLPLEMSS
jgi:hypothetical protein